jgi:hypothetical protein
MEGRRKEKRSRKVIILSKDQPGWQRPLESRYHIPPFAQHASQSMYSKVLSDAMLEQLEQLESVPEFDSSDSGSESVGGKSSCEMECQVSSLGIDDE